MLIVQGDRISLTPFSGGVHQIPHDYAVCSKKIIDGIGAANSEAPYFHESVAVCKVSQKRTTIPHKTELIGVQKSYSTRVTIIGEKETMECNERRKDHCTSFEE